MSARVSLQARVEQYLTERRKLGFALRSMGPRLLSFALRCHRRSPRAVERRTEGSCRSSAYFGRA